MKQNYHHARGVAERRDQFGNVTECDTFTCGHCMKVKEIPPDARAEDTVGRMCTCCMRVICGDCKNLSTCDVIEKKLERAEARNVTRRSYGF